MKNNLEMFNNIACSESCKVSGISGGYGACGKRIDPSSSSCFILKAVMSHGRGLLKGIV